MEYWSNGKADHQLSSPIFHYSNRGEALACNPFNYNEF